MFGGPLSPCTSGSVGHVSKRPWDVLQSGMVRHIDTEMVAMGRSVQGRGAKLSKFRVG